MKLGIFKEEFLNELLEVKGVWAQASTLEACREELQSALEDWLILGLRMGHKLPVVDGIQLIPSEA